MENKVAWNGQFTEQDWLSVCQLSAEAKLKKIAEIKFKTLL